MQQTPNTTTTSNASPVNPFPAPSPQADPGATAAIANFHPWIVTEVAGLIKQHDWVIVGMGQNPVVKSARKYLDAKDIKHHYVGYGNYMSMWKPRLALKLWAKWPTFPQVYHKGVLIGGFKDLKAYMDSKKN